jgi:hypothetical protein
VEILTHAFHALWQVALVALILGAGLPALFALGLRSLASNRPLTADGAEFAGQPTAVGRAGAVICFGISVAAVAFGIVVIIFGKQVFGG